MEFQDARELDGLEVKVAELLVATADESDHMIDGSVGEVLKLLRQKMKMDVVFVSEFTNGERVFRCVDQTPGPESIAAGASDPLEQTWCQRVVDGRMPELVADVPAAQARGEVPALPAQIGTFLSTPIVLAGGEVYGTLCCFSYGINPKVTAQDVKTLRYTAQLTASKIGRARKSNGELEWPTLPASEPVRKP